MQRNLPAAAYTKMSSAGELEVDRQYPGTAVERLRACVARVKGLEPGSVSLLLYLWRPVIASALSDRHTRAHGGALGTKATAPR